MGIWCPFFPGQSLFSSVRTLLYFMLWTFVSSKSTLLCSPKYQDTSWSTSSYVMYVHIELSTCFNVKLIAFIVCVIGPGKIGLFYKLHFIDGYFIATLMTFLFTQSKHRIVGFLRQKFFINFMNQLPFVKILPSKCLLKAFITIFSWRNLWKFSPKK